MSTFWQGEFYWHGTRLATWSVDAVYVVSSTLFLLTFVIGHIARGGRKNGESRLSAVSCLLVFALYLALLVLVSVSFDFGACFYPSREWPYLSSGRLILGALVPFLIIYLGGLDVLLSWLRLSLVRVPAIIVIVGIMAVSEIVLIEQRIREPIQLVSPAVAR